MNNIKKIMRVLLLGAAVLMQMNSVAKQGSVRGSAQQQAQQMQNVVTEADVDEVINEETAQIKQMIIEVKKMEDTANAAIADAQDKFERGEISRAQEAAIIGEQKYVIKQAKETLKQAVEQSAQKVEEAEGYLSKFVSGVKSWYYGPEEKRAVAEAVIDELEKGLIAVQNEYAEKIKNARSNRNKAELRAELDQEKAEFEAKIKEQREIAEGRMSSQKFWGAVGLAGAVIGGALAYGAYKYLGGATPKVDNIRDLFEEKITAPEGFVRFVGEVPGQYRKSTHKVLQKDLEPGVFAGSPVVKKFGETVQPYTKEFIESFKTAKRPSEELPLEFGAGAQPGESYADKSWPRVKKSFGRVVPSYEGGGLELSPEALAEYEEGIVVPAKKKLGELGERGMESAERAIEPYLPVSDESWTEPTPEELPLEFGAGAQPGESYADKSWPRVKKSFGRVVPSYEGGGLELSPEALAEYEEGIVVPAKKKLGELGERGMESAERAIEPYLPVSDESWTEPTPTADYSAWSDMRDAYGKIIAGVGAPVVRTGETVQEKIGEMRKSSPQETSQKESEDVQSPAISQVSVQTPTVEQTKEDAENLLPKDE